MPPCPGLDSELPPYSIGPCTDKLSRMQGIGGGDDDDDDDHRHLVCHKYRLILCTKPTGGCLQQPKSFHHFSLGNFTIF